MERGLKISQTSIRIKKLGRPKHNRYRLQVSWPRATERFKTGSRRMKTINCKQLDKKSMETRKKSRNKKRRRRLKKPKIKRKKMGRLKRSQQSSPS